MCRIIALKTSNIDQTKLALDQFRLLADCGCVPVGVPKGHRDGWGLAGYRGGRSVFLKRSPRDAAGDVAYPRAVKALLSKKPDLTVGHLRKATVGKRTVNNTQPFMKDGFTFAHNGTVRDTTIFNLTVSAKRVLKGETDSEKLFVFLLEYMKGAKTPTAIRNAFRRAIRFVRSNSDYTAMNIIFSNGRYVWALRDFNPHNVVVKEKNLKGYYTLYVGRQKTETTVVSSERLALDATAWKPLANRALLEWDTETGRANIFKI
jgi:predicted glutamine amidotransferase